MFLAAGITAALLSIILAGAIFWFAKKRNDLKNDLRLAREEHSLLLNEYSAVKKRNRSLNRAVTDVENLYEVTRRMSRDLEFDDIFRTFNDFFNKGVRFRECKLLLMGRERDNLYCEKAYRMKHPFESGEKDLRVSPPELKDEIALEIFHGDQRPVFLSVDKNRDVLHKFYPKRDIRTLASNPLIVEDDLIGILVVEDLVEKDFDKFIILSSQLALEIKKVKLYEEIQKLAIIDGLTGVYMRRHFLERAAEEVKRAEHHKLNISFLMIDMDHFKICNDRHGHLMGDAVLSQMAEILKSNVREIDIICRYGGEEFAIALPDTGKESAVIVAERIREAVEEHAFQAYGDSAQVTVSIGVSSYPGNGGDLKQAVEAADNALYNAKHTGRNSVCEA